MKQSIILLLLNAYMGMVGSHWPKNRGLYWFMPALVNSRVGSSWGTHGLLGQKVWPCSSRKNSIKASRTRTDGHGPE